MGDSKKSVPDSCCLFEAPGCGQNVFEISDVRVIVQKINIHGCLFVMKRMLDKDIPPILLIFSGVASILAVMELFSVWGIFFRIRILAVNFSCNYIRFLMSSVISLIVVNHT